MLTIEKRLIEKYGKKSCQQNADCTRTCESKYRLQIKVLLSQNALRRGETLKQNQPQRYQYSLQYTRTQVKNVYAIVVPSLLVRIKKSRVSTSAGAVLLIFFNIWLTLNLYEETICTKILKSMKSFQASNIKRLFFQTR